MSNDTELQADLVAHERRVWDALVAGDADADARLLKDDFLGIYSDGFATKADHIRQLARGPSIASYSISMMLARALGSQHAVLSYRAEFIRVGLEMPEVMFVTSIWQRDGDGWLNVLSQDTSSTR